MTDYLQYGAVNLNNRISGNENCKDECDEINDGVNNDNGVEHQVA